MQKYRNLVLSHIHVVITHLFVIYHTNMLLKANKAFLNIFLYARTLTKQPHTLN